MINITPIPKPRMTISDAWKKRPVVMAYWAFKDEFRMKVDLALSGKKRDSVECGVLSVEFHLPMPSSWSRKKKLKFEGRPHLSKPDLDNLVKAVMDCLYESDSHIHTIYARKFWTAKGGGIDFLSTNPVKLSK